MRNYNRFTALLTPAVVYLASLSGCATETHAALEVTRTAAVATASTYSGSKSSVVVGDFANRSAYLRGIFFDGVDWLGSQARTILIGHLQETGRFSVLDRENMKGLSEEADLSGKPQALRGADYMITGDVVEFGRRETGDEQLFGLLGSGRRQAAYSKVTLNVVEVLSSRVIFTASGAGEYALTDREVIGFGGTSGYDSTLNGKVLDLAIRQAVDRLVTGIEQGSWRPGKENR